MQKIILILAAILSYYGFAATPQVKNVKAFQQYPWNNKVLISYEVEGNVAASAGNGKTPFLFVTAKDRSTGHMYGTVSSGESYLKGDTETATGLHRIVWDIAAQGVTINSANVAFTVVYCDELYLVVDLSSGSNSSAYPISYLYAVPSSGWTDDYKTMKLVLRRIEAGTYKMQDSSDVTLTKPFFCGIFEMTQKQYSLVMGSNPSCFSGDTLPVENVSYNAIRGLSNGAKWPSSSAVDSDSFMGKLRARTGIDFDLPTEAQWEYACRAGTTTTYYWGDSMNGNYAWSEDNSSGKTHPVGTKTPNVWGIYDMSGNVVEWCLDWYDDTLSYGTDPQGPSWALYRVMRGGGWRPGSCTSSHRFGIAPSREFDTFGFRIVGNLSE